ncbi:fructose-1-phosphate kinase [Atopostipes suicloacalis DSM 15692]|uniref:Tagatose-6-phosphate kinase n=1 Tax=Atopostipes suicloacalis DSM 15692 TaxID=1121025 RepID=A0A1M4UGQ1_9LACT|nr:1-phosphofructokinase [Atopostipes suicloacalis]SHE55931.1 fructose-1-phosphate kinase [Atopostipes suicloacalis DSM 15692]
MIYTLTLNPSIDYIMPLEHLQLGATNYAQGEYMLPGGKGINVSRVLNQLNVPNQALGFIGGHTGKFIEEWLEKEGAACQFIPVEGQTRINVKLKGESETEINGRGPEISQEKSRELKKQIGQLTAQDTLVISGSKNKGLSETFYNEIIEICQKNQTSFILDTNSKELLEALVAQPFLVKPNQAELGDLFGETIQTKEEAIHYGKKLQEAGAQNVIVSLGGEGAIFIDESQVIIADSPKGKVKNTVGSGDSMIAGFIAGIEKGKSKEEAFKLGVQSGSATAFNEDLATKKEIEALNDQIKTREVE